MINLRESIGTSCTVVMGPNSGTLTFRRRTTLCWLIRVFSEEPPAGCSSVCSSRWAAAGAGVLSIGVDLVLFAVFAVDGCRGKSWYLFCWLGGGCCCILQVKGFTVVVVVVLVMLVEIVLCWWISGVSRHTPRRLIPMLGTGMSCPSIVDL